MISVIVPAHDEATVIERCLKRLCDGSEGGELEVIVVCNGCRDDTAARARAVSGPIRVIESPVASKADALNRGEAAAHGFPRFYVDADVILPLASLREVARVLRAGGALAAAPRAEIDLSRSSRPVRSFYRVWTRSPYFGEAMIGSGVYALSEAGRRRFASFPEIIADDEFVRRQFTASEIHRVDTCTFTIMAPTRLSGVIAIKTRSRLGRLQLAQRFPELRGPEGGGVRRRLWAMFSRPASWPHLAVYAFVNVVTRARARRRFSDGSFSSWDRDETSRTKSPA